MTAQIPDTVEVSRVTYSIAGVRGGPLFGPNDHGIQAAAFSTACWRGYACSYCVQDRSLRLVKLMVGEGSKVAGQEANAGDRVLGSTLTEGTGWARHALEAAVSLPVPFTGTLLLGDRFIGSTYVHMGFHPAWKFETVIELVLKNGRVTATRDRSVELAAVRERIAGGELADPDGTRGGTRWVKRCFSLDYGRSFPAPGNGSVPPKPRS